MLRPMSIQGSWTIPEFTAGDRFRKARETVGQSQREFATTIGVDKNTVSAYETGATTNHRKIVVNAWALATGVPVEWLLHGVDPTGPSGDGVPHGTSGPHGLNGTRNAHVVALSSVRDLAA